MPKRKSRRYLAEVKHAKIQANASTQIKNKENKFKASDIFVNIEDNCEFSDDCEIPVPSDSVDDDFNLRLAQWFSANNISRYAANELLSLLSKKIPCLPNDLRTLKSTPQQVIKGVMPPGEYIHYGIKDALTDFLINYSYISNNISLNINVDGLPLFKSSLKQTWPILINVNGTKPVMVVGIYVGNSKPQDPNIYLDEFSRELCNLIKTGMTFKDRKLSVTVRAFICDAPARAFILGVKHHSGFYSCNQCLQKGESFQRRIIFKMSENLPRTDYSFRNRLQPEHHNLQNQLVLEMLPIDLVVQFPNDYMHVVCLGVMKSLLVALVRVRGHPFSLSRDLISSLNARLIALKPFFPVEFNRKPRSLDDLERFKATEFRTFVLYTGPVVLKDILDSDQYNHFLLFSLGIRLLLDSEYCTSKNDFASALLNNFVKEMPQRYMSSMVTFNYHCLTHLSKQCLVFGSLQTISAFPFENFLGHLKKMVKKFDYVIEQIHNRIVERSHLNVILKEKKFNSGPNKLSFKDLHFNLKDANSFYYIKKNGIYKIFKIFSINDKSLHSRLILDLEPFYTYPVHSSRVGIFSSTCINFDTQVWQHKIEEISGKMMHFMDNCTHIYIPLIN